MTTYTTFDDTVVNYFKEHPEEIDDFVTEIFDDYVKDGETAVLLSSLRIVARVKGISNIAEQANMSRQGVQKALSANSNPRLESFMAIVRAMGYQFVPQKIGNPTRPSMIGSSSHQIANMMDEAGVTLTDLLEDLPKIREEIYRERLIERETAVAESGAEYHVK